ncbi:MAG: TetR/AcrR family transcriptional regulator [Deltaproteobacteria bacterium]|nr:TetR/AcrR family transcriptional regulator [Deltaproteobacteria bacterium]
MIAHARTDILDAAIRAFARTGLHGTTVQDIAREAGYTAASLYTYFKSKQEIVDAMSNLLTEEYVQVFDQAVPAGLTFHQRFELVLHRHLELVEKRKNVFVTLFGEDSGGGLCGPDGHGKTFHTNFERRIAVLAEWFHRNARPEDIGGNDPKIIARLLFGMAFGLLHEMRDNLQQGSFVNYAPILTEFFFHGVSSKLKPGVRKK